MLDEKTHLRPAPGVGCAEAGARVDCARSQERFRSAAFFELLHSLLHGRRIAARAIHPRHHPFREALRLLALKHLRLLLLADDDAPGIARRRGRNEPRGLEVGVRQLEHPTVAGLAYEIAYAEDEFLTFKGCAAAYEVATRFFGDDIAFENTSPLRPRECRRARSRASGRPRRNAGTPASSSAGCLNANIEPELGEGARTRTPAL